MPLTVRTNGNLPGNIVGASWWNDYYNLLTGGMTDQEVTIQNNLVLKAIGTAPSSGMTAAVVAGTGLGIGAYLYAATFTSPDGESTPSPNVSATTTSGNQKVNLAAIPTGPTGTTGRNLYRTVVGGATLELLHSITDNTTTTYTDTTTDSSLGATAPASPTFGGALILKNSSGVTTFVVRNDGSMSAGGGGSFGNTVIGGTLSVTGNATFNSDVFISNGKLSKLASGDILDASTSDLHVKAKGGTIYFDSPSGTNNMSLDNAGHLTLTNNIVWQNGNGLGRTSLFNGTGSGTYNHNLGATPTFLVPIVNQLGSATQGFDSVGSTTCHLTLGASLTFTCLAWR